ncbi:hypothetical protein CANTEDRAFT_135716 [Yamadazyma tenuis ATCC 10573]|uniref:Uncharacterized protein n=1 Tax=Candida tenuis (strain ATCC 10573 / BCRC 21748 / CBS 615 / JCM 9827 / NBRC 10315 / NRRL Y-1498 / VKM Y-70) TaxID=590646 RepID=G3B8N8_CANTC|nr:uncharacterized protein CANTEDRAFT_135716 [Yamadazyma tenuis ATCC 10573]EGV61778.1 hypothetical protein CANTEDRAFT_135716 [Yamadazyma tenuis ATCC 10573]
MDVNLIQVQQHIERLYSTRDPGEIQSLQSVLLNLQRQDDGHLAKSLLGTNSKNCQYFGALTYTVVINNIREFDESHLQSLKNDLISSIGNNTYNWLVIKKLISNYCLLFIFNYKQFQADPINSLLVQLTVEELIKKEQINELHEIMFSQLFPYVYSTYEHLNSCLISSIPYSVHILGLDCLNSWIGYISMSETQSKIRYTDTPELTRYVFSFLEGLQFDSSESLELINKSVSAITEILEVNPNMLDFNKKLYLKSLLFEETKFGGRFINEIVLNVNVNEEFTDEISNFVNLCIIFLQNGLLNMAKHLTEPTNRFILNLLLKLTNYPGIPKVEENVSDQFLSFWEEFFNVFIDDEEAFDSLYKDENTKLEFYSTRNAICNEVCKIYWEKIKLPAPEQLQLNRSDFFYFKSTVGDFFSIVYSLLKLSFYKDLVELAGSKFSSSELDLNGLESALFILHKVNDDSTFYESQSNLLINPINSLMEAGLLKILPSLTPAIPNYFNFVSTFINFISSIQFYLKTDHGPKYLGDILEFLFSIIINSKDPKLSLTSSKTILNICQECGPHLVVFLPTLKNLLNEMIQNDQIDNLIRARMANSYISISHSANLKSPREFSSVLIELLSVIETRAGNLMANVSILEEHAEDYLISLLSCVTEIGKSSVLPGEVEDLYTQEEANAVSDFWKNDTTVKPLILSIIRKYSIDFQPFSNKSTITEICCQIFKTGLNEPIHNPFKFDLPVIFEYLALKIRHCDANSLYHIFKLIETITLTNYKLLDELTVNDLLTNVFIPHFKDHDSNSDPDMLSSSTDVFTSMLDKKPSLLLYSNVNLFVEVLHYSVNLFKSNEVSIIKSLSKFWTAVILLKRGSQQDQELVQNIFQQSLGRLLLQELLSSFLNNSRSSLECYYLVFRSLISKYQLFVKNWLMEILPNMNWKHVNDHDKKLFIDKLLLTRGQRSANEVLKKFWLQVNGLVEFNSKNY